MSPVSSLIDEVRVRWPIWFGESAPKNLSHAFVARPSAAPRRGVILVGAEERRTFAVVLKVALEPSSNLALARESARMREVASLFEERQLPALVPRVIDQFQWNDLNVVVQEFRRGSPIEVPLGGSRGKGNRSATRYVGTVQSVSQSLARLAPARTQSARGVFERFAQHAERAGEGVLASESRRLSRLPVQFPIGWQHGDLAPGNLLVHRRLVTVIDWEMARPDLPLFFDLAYAYLSLLMMGGHGPSRINSEVSGTQILSGGSTLVSYGTFDLRGCEPRHRHRLALTMTACLATMRAEDLGRSGPDSAWWPIATNLVSSGVSLLT